MATDDIRPDESSHDAEIENGLDPQAQAAAEAVSHKRVWEDDVGTGDLVPFDSERYRAKLTPEQLEAAEKPKG